MYIIHSSEGYLYMFSVTRREWSVVYPSTNIVALKPLVD